MKTFFTRELLERIQQQIDTLTGMSATSAFDQISHESTDEQCQDLGASLMLDLRDWRRLEKTIRSGQFPSTDGEIEDLMNIVEMMIHDSAE